MSDPSMSQAKLEAAIREAFGGVQLGGGISLRQAEVIDNYGGGVTDAEFRALPAQEITDDWTALPAEELGRNNTAHLDAEGLRYYLPAFMLRLLDHYGDGSQMWEIGTIGALDQRDRHSLGFLELLTPRQRSVIALYVRALPELVELDADGAWSLARAFRDVWSRYLAAEDQLYDPAGDGIPGFALLEPPVAQCPGMSPARIPAFPPPHVGPEGA